MAKSLDALRRDLIASQDAIHASMQDMRNAQDEAEAANAAKSQLLANISHEIRTPMNGIVGMADHLLGQEIPQNQRDALEIIQSSSTALVEIINDILDFSKLEKGMLELQEEPTDIDDLVYELVEVIRRGMEKPDVRFVVSITPAVPAILVTDPKRLRQILLKLIGNAYKFTLCGEVAVHLDFNDGRLVVQVADTGVGIASDDIGKIFGSFAQADNSQTRRFEGTGLGLAITKRLVDVFGGRISVTSELGKGSCFDVSLPVKVSQLKAAPLSSERILLCDLPDELADFWKVRFERLGATVHVATAQNPRVICCDGGDGGPTAIVCGGALPDWLHAVSARAAKYFFIKEISKNHPDGIGLCAFVTMLLWCRNFRRQCLRPRTPLRLWKGCAFWPSKTMQPIDWFSKNCWLTLARCWSLASTERKLWNN